MDFPNDLLTVFNHWKPCFKILKQWWATVIFVTEDRAIFHKISNILWSQIRNYVVMGLKICMGDEHHRYYKHTKFCQNPRGNLTISCWFDMEW